MLVADREELFLGGIWGLSVVLEWELEQGGD